MGISDVDVLIGGCAADIQWRLYGRSHRGYAGIPRIIFGDVSNFCHPDRHGFPVPDLEADGESLGKYHPAHFLFHL